MTKIAEQVVVSLGDKIYHGGVLCEITELNPNFIYAKSAESVNHLISVEELNGKKFDFIIEFSKKGDLFGKSRTDNYEKATKEETLLKELGWETKLYRQERK